MKKFAFIGAGSLQFTTSCIIDLLYFEAFSDSEFYLMDTNADNLKSITKICERILVEMNKPKCKIVPTMSREAALKNIVRMLFFLIILTPCLAMQRYSNVEVTGLCHSVQHTVDMLAEWLNVPVSEVDYTCMGVNHQAFYTKLTHNGKNLYPLLKEKLKEEEFYNKEIVRNEMFLKLGYYPTESSGHNSEYNAWFRKRPDLIKKYCLNSTNWNPGEYAFCKKI